MLYFVNRLYDIDNSGDIDVHEMENILEILDNIHGNPEPSTLSPDGSGALSRKERAEMFLKSLDIDGDGSVTLEEFLKVDIICRYKIFFFRIIIFRVENIYLMMMKKVDDAENVICFNKILHCHLFIVSQQSLLFILSISM